MTKMAVNLVGIFLAFVLVSNAGGDECPSPENVITMEDVRDALRAVTFLQGDVKVGSTIPGTKFDVNYLDKDDGGGVQIMSAEFGNSVILVFQAPKRAEDKFMKDQFDFLKHFGLQEVSFNDKEMKVSHSIYKSYGHMQPKVKKLLEGIKEGKRFIITGYSIGGSISSLVALLMSEETNNKLFKNDRSSLITFGQTRLGDVNFAKVHDDVISPWRKLRFVFRGDPVTKIPPYNQWVHHSRAVYLGNEKTKISSKLKKRSGIPNANTSAEINEYDRATLSSLGEVIDDIDAGMDHETGIDEEEESRTLSEEKSYEESERMLNDDDGNLVQQFNHTDDSEKIMDEVEKEEEEREENEMRAMNDDTNGGGMSESGNGTKVNESMSEEKEMPEEDTDIDQDNKNNTVRSANSEETVEKQSEMGSGKSEAVTGKSGTVSEKSDNETESFIIEEKIPKGESETGSGKSKTIDPEIGVKIDNKETDQNKIFKFLQICDEQEDDLCVVKHENLISNISDHALSNYLAHLLQGPVEYLTRKGIRKFSLEEASLATCNEMKEAAGKSSP